MNVSNNQERKKWEFHADGLSIGGCESLTLGLAYQHACDNSPERLAQKFAFEDGLTSTLLGMMMDLREKDSNARLWAMHKFNH